MLNESPPNSNDQVHRYEMSKFELSLMKELEVPGEHFHHPSPPAKLIKSKSKGKNILRLNTKSGEIGFKDESKRKRKKLAKNIKPISSGKSC